MGNPEQVVPGDSLRRDRPLLIPGSRRQVEQEEFLYDELCRRLNVESHIRENCYVCDGLLLPTFIPPSCLAGIREFEVRDSDTYVITWPKSGDIVSSSLNKRKRELQDLRSEDRDWDSTSVCKAQGTMWTSYIVTQILRGQKYTDSHVLDDSAIFMEFPQNPGDKNTEGKYKSAATAPSPRLFRTHLPIRCFPKDLLTSGAKIVYVARNPKDVAVSFYYFCVMNATMPTYASWDECFDLFCEGLVTFGDWFDHVLPAWEQRDNPNVLFLKYEDMKKDLKATVGVLSDFLEKPLTQMEVEEICKKSTFKMMKANDKVNPDNVKGLVPRTVDGKHIDFMRKGEVGDWKNLFTVAQSERLDDIFRMKTAGTGLEFTFE